LNPHFRALRADAVEGVFGWIRAEFGQDSEAA